MLRFGSTLGARDEGVTTVRTIPQWLSVDGSGAGVRRNRICDMRPVPRLELLLGESECRAGLVVNPDEKVPAVPAVAEPDYCASRASPGPASRWARSSAPCSRPPTRSLAREGRAPADPHRSSGRGPAAAYQSSARPVAGQIATSSRRPAVPPVVSSKPTTIFRSSAWAIRRSVSRLVRCRPFSIREICE